MTSTRSINALIRSVDPFGSIRPATQTGKGTREAGIRTTLIDQMPASPSNYGVTVASTRRFMTKLVIAHAERMIAKPIIPETISFLASSVLL